jgi:hypothetical protein
MHLNLVSAAEYVLAIYGIYAVAGYFIALRDGKGHLRAVLSVFLGYVVLFLILGGAVTVLVGVGWLEDNSPQFCGSGCYEPGEGRFGAPHLSFIPLGICMIVAGWLAGRGMGRIDEAIWERKDRKRESRAAAKRQSEASDKKSRSAEEATAWVELLRTPPRACY